MFSGLNVMYSAGLSSTPLSRSVLRLVSRPVVVPRWVVMEFGITSVALGLVVGTGGWVLPGLAVEAVVGEDWTIIVGEGMTARVDVDEGTLTTGGVNVWDGAPSVAVTAFTAVGVNVKVGVLVTAFTAVGVNVKVGDDVTAGT